MPSFDVVSEVDLQEVRNAVDQANREVGTRFDFKGVDASFDLKGAEITLRAEQEFQLKQMRDILRQKLVKRSVDVGSMEVGPSESSLNAARQQIVMKQGIATDLAAAGIVGLAVGFGAQSLVQDVISGFFILLEDQIRVGDVVQIADKSGVVERITLRMVVLKYVKIAEHDR